MLTVPQKHSKTDKFRHILAIAAALLIIIGSIPLMPPTAVRAAAVAPALGDGTSEDPYQISEPGNMEWLADRVNAGDTNYNDKCYILTQDISLSVYGTNWVPIGSSTNAFKGSFDGNGKNIRDLGITDFTLDYVGLFGYAIRARIENLNLVTVNIDTTSGRRTGGNTTGGVVGRLYNGRMENCSVSGSVTGVQYVGGVAGSLEANSIIEYCNSKADVIGTGSYKLVSGQTHYITPSSSGGVVGRLSGSSIKNCYATTGNVAMPGSDYGNAHGGGVVGFLSSSSMKNCYATNNVTGYWAGGLVGRADAADKSIERSCFTGSVTGAVCVGGIVGHADEIKIINCFSTGSVSGSSVTGGSVGHIQKYTEISYSYSSGETLGSNKTGGIAGGFYNDTGTSYGYVENCAALNPRVSASADVGRVLGYKQSTGTAFATLSNNFGLVSMAAGSKPFPVDNLGDSLNGADIDDATARTASFWMDDANWKGSGWDTDTWFIKDGAYPEFVGITVEPETAEINKGNTQQLSFTAFAWEMYQAQVGQNVTWTVEGNGAGTSIDQNGVLTIDKNETADTLTVRAASVIDSGRSATAEVTLLPAIPVYGIELSESGTCELGEEDLGYSAQTPHTVTVTNTGNQPTDDLTISLSGTNASAFTLSKMQIDSLLAENDEDTFTIVPNTGLESGIYTADVTVSGEHGISEAFTVSFTVNGEVTISPDEYDFISLEEGYSTQEESTFTITNDTVYTLEEMEAAFDGDGQGSFEISTPLSALTLLPKETATVVVCPKTGLTENSAAYTGSLLVNWKDGGAGLSADLSVIVNPAFVPVTDITNVPANATAGTALTLSGTVVPNNATNQTIVWSLKSAGTTGATVIGGILNAASGGTATVTATITNGISPTEDYVEDFDIVVNPAFVPVTDIINVPDNATAGTALTLSGTVVPANATNKTIVWSLKSAGTTGATVIGGTFNATSGGTATVTATITNGTSPTEDYVEDFDIVVNPAFVPVTDIINVPANATAGTALTLSGTVVPANATNKTIVWSLKSAGTTGATVIGGIFNATSGGTATVTATITNGISPTEDYVEDFDIVVNPAFVPVTDIINVPANATAGTALTLSGTVVPANATNKTIVWSLKSAGTTGATVIGGTFNAASEGTATVTATITNGTSPTEDYIEDFIITVTAKPVIVPPVIVPPSSPTYYPNYLNIYAAEGGRILRGSSGDYYEGEVINISAGANSNYVFDRWVSTNGGSFGNQYSTDTTFTMPDASTNVIAYFYYSTGGSSRNQYTDAYISPSYAEFYKNAVSELSIRLYPGSYTLRGLTYNNRTLVEGTDYRVSGGYYVFTSSFLSALSVGEHRIVFDMNGGADPVLYVSITDAPEAPVYVPPVYIAPPAAAPAPVRNEQSSGAYIETANYPAITVEINGTKVDFSGQPAVLKNNWPLLPVRETFEKLGYKVEWNQASRTATIKKDKTIVTITNGDIYYTMHGFPYIIGDIPAQTLNGCLMMTSLDVLERLGYRVYRDLNNVVHIY